MSLRVAIAEDSYLVREAVRQLLERASEIEVVAVCEDTQALLEAVEREAARCGGQRHLDAAVSGR